MAQEYSRILHALTQKPWNIRQSTLDLMCEVVLARASGVQLTKDEIQAQLGTQAARPTQQIIGTVGVIPVFGILAQRMDMFLDISGGTSYQQLLKQFRDFRDDPQVKAIVFQHDSPGGEVFGLVEAAEEIYAARAVKRLIAVVDPQSASASYFLACACPEIVITPSGQAGCIGTIWCHTDYSKQNEMIGIDPTYLVSSPYKAEGNSDEPLGDDARAYIQSQIDAYGDQFEKFVAKARGTTVAKVKSDFGGGRMLLAKDAVKVGLCDRIATMDETIAKLVGRKGAVAVSGARAAATRVVPVLEGAHRAAFHTETETLDETEARMTPPVFGQDAIDADACPACKGAGLKPERFMSDPQGQETCPECGGTGKAPAAAADAKAPNADDEGTPPDENGECAEGYALDEDDGLCYPIETVVEPDAQAAADRDAFDLTRATGL